MGTMNLPIQILSVKPREIETINGLFINIFDSLQFLAEFKLTFHAR